MSATTHRSGTPRIEPSGHKRPLTRSKILVCWAILMFGYASYASARDWYMSDCAQGGSGTLQDPYCLDPDSDGVRESFEALMDGSGAELAAGDTVHLCAGDCDGQGTSTYHLDSDGDGTIFTPIVSGTQNQPITITVYPGETVIISGDANANNVYDSSTDANSILTMDSDDGNGDLYHYHWLGDPTGSGQPHLIFEKTDSIMFGLKGNPHGWIFDSVILRYGGACIWSGHPQGGMFRYFDQCAPFDGGAMAFKQKKLNGPFEVRNSQIYGFDAYAFRQQCGKDSAGPGAAMVAENNDFYNMLYVNNDYNCDNQKWLRNRVYDVWRGIQVEDRMTNIVIADNTVECRGVWLDACQRGISVTDGDFGGDTTGKSQNITVARNRIFGTSSDRSGQSPGSMYMGIEWTADNDSGPINGLIENNMLWNINHKNSGEGVDRSPLTVQSNKPVIVRNNTIYAYRNSIYLDGEPSGGAVAHEFYNNLMGRDQTHGSDEMEVTGSASGSSIHHNNFYGDGANGVVSVGGRATAVPRLEAWGPATSAFNRSSRIRRRMTSRVGTCTLLREMVTSTWERRDLPRISTAASVTPRWTSARTSSVPKAGEWRRQPV